MRKPRPARDCQYAGNIPTSEIMYLSLFIRCSARSAVAEVTGEIDLSSGPWLQESLLSFLRTSETRLLADLSDVTFIDCSGLRMLLATCQRAELQDCSLRLPRCRARSCGSPS
ncbi:MAG TPA: STAS domain-containing protein [Streptosporangiaceae bacterium]|nr:STAS domain-containing protein [Streptosporangiaceae bacterium]